MCNDQLAYALAVGMTAKEFWEGDISLFWVYMRAAKIKRQQEDHLAWVQGYYNSCAFADVLSAMFAGKGKKHKSIYPEKPLFTGDGAARKKTENRKKTAQDRAAEIILERLSQLNERTNQPFYEKKDESQKG